MDTPRKIVLVVDDDEGIRKLLAEVLHLKGRCHVIEASSACQGINLAREMRPDLVLLDAVMPEVDGWQACKILKTDPATASTKVAILMELSQASRRRKSKEVGADYLLEKHISTRDLAKKVREILDS